MLPVTGQATSSLLLGLQAALAWPEFMLGPRTEHSAMDFWAELERRQIPVERIVRTVILPTAAKGVRALALFPRIRAAGGWDESAPSSDALDEMGAYASDWHAVIDQALADDLDRRMPRGKRRREDSPAPFTELLQSTGALGVSPANEGAPVESEFISRLVEDRGVRYVLSQGFFDRLVEWLDQLLSNRLDAFLQWKTPAYSIFKALPVHARGTDEVALWIWERFTVTRAEDWSSTSLMQEWQVGTSGASRASGLPPTVLGERKVDVDQAASLALSKSYEQIQSEARPMPLAASRFVDAAVEMLRGGQYREAANIFAGVVDLSPRDGDALNNLGFCLLPVDPQAALEALQRSSLLHRSNPLISTANRVLALHLVGRNDAALALADEPVAAESESRVWAWRHECGQPLALEADVDAAIYLRGLKNHIASG
jgi:hypothetical protein